MRKVSRCRRKDSENAKDSHFQENETETKEVNYCTERTRSSGVEKSNARIVMEDEVPEGDSIPTLLPRRKTQLGRGKPEFRKGGGRNKNKRKRGNPRNWSEDS